MQSQTNLNEIELRQTWFGTWDYWVRFPHGGGIGSASPFRRRTDALLQGIETNDGVRFFITVKWSETLFDPDVDGIIKLTKTWARR